MRQLLHPSPFVTQTPDTTIIHFSGSGLVYSMDRHGQLERHDRTFYAGYNYGAQRHYDGQRLWSLGGSGLWNTTDLTIFYDSELREWERREMTPPIEDGFTGMLASAESPDLVYALFMDGPNNKQLEPHYTAYKVDLSANTYTPIGVASERSKGPTVGQLSPFGQWNRTNIVAFENRLYLADMVQNTVHACEPIMDVYSNNFNGTHGMILSPQGLYLIQTASTVTNVHVKIERWSFDELLARGKPVLLGPIYESTALATAKNNWKALLVVLIGAVSLTGLILRYQRTRPSIERHFAQALSPLCRIALRHLLLQSPDSLVTPDELNQILGIEDKTWDNQRKIRSTVLQELEEKGMQYLGVPSFIERVASEEDRRIRRYRIKPEFRDDLLPILKHV